MTGFAVALADEASPDTSSQWAGVSKIFGPRWAQTPILTIGLVGVQVMWSVEMSYASPYLVSLGLSKSLMAVVFVAGPVSGLVVQPLIGVLADRSKSRFGRRRPYILAGVTLCTVAFLLLGFTRQFASIFTSTGSSANDIWTIWLAIFSIFCIDFGINAVQSVDRALIVDTLPSPEQPSGNAWAARMLGIGSVAGFFFGGVDMTHFLPFLGKTELQVLSVVASFLLIATHLTTAYFVKERVLLASSQARKTFGQEIKTIWTTFRTLPHAIKQICIIQFFAWLGWFPSLFYTSLYIGDLYRRSLSPSNTTPLEEINAEANRLGSQALLYSAIVSLLTNFLAPYLIAPKKPGNLVLDGATAHVQWWRRKMHLATLWAISHMVFATCMIATLLPVGVTGATILMAITGFSWGITQWAPFSLLAEAILTSPVPAIDPDLDDAQSILLADVRSSRSFSRPRDEELFAVAEEDDEDGDLEENDRTAKPLSKPAHPEWSEDDEEDNETTPRNEARVALMGNAGAARSWVNVRGVDDQDEVLDDPEMEGGVRQSGLSGKAGIILGIHNIFIVVPQFLVTGLASIIFAILEPDKSVIHAPAKDPAARRANGGAFYLTPREGSLDIPSGPNSVAIIFRCEHVSSPVLRSANHRTSLGGLAAIVAFIICWRLAGYLHRRD
ncbi:MFS general substrate transporter [Amylostereum chailletii]|nr:MFS general substrate transporter [Amylostereum chailletii]